MHDIPMVCPQVFERRACDDEERNLLDALLWSGARLIHGLVGLGTSAAPSSEEIAALLSQAQGITSLSMDLVIALLRLRRFLVGSSVPLMGMFPSFTRRVCMSFLHMHGGSLWVPVHVLKFVSLWGVTYSLEFCLPFCTVSLTGFDFTTYSAVLADGCCRAGMGQF